MPKTTIDVSGWECNQNLFKDRPELDPWPVSFEIKLVGNPALANPAQLAYVQNRIKELTKLKRKVGAEMYITDYYQVDWNTFAALKIAFPSAFISGVHSFFEMRIEIKRHHITLLIKSPVASFEFDAEPLHLEARTPEQIQNNESLRALSVFSDSLKKHFDQDKGGENGK